MRILIAFATTEGHTGKVAEFIAARLREAGHEVTLQDVARAAAGLDLTGFDRVAVAGSIHIGRFQKALVDFATAHRAALADKGAALVVVSLAATAKTSGVAAGLDDYVNHFAAQTGWTPAEVEHVAGALAYTRYGFFTRVGMRFGAKRAGWPTDTSRDHDFTDWEALRGFAARLVA